MIKSILVGLIGTEYAGAVEEAAIDLSVRHGAEVTAVTGVSLSKLSKVGPVPVGGATWAKALRKHRINLTRSQVQDAVRSFEEAANRASIQYKILNEEREEPFDFLESRSRYADLTVLSLRSIFEYGIHTDSDTDPSVTIARLLAGGVRPILAIPATIRPVRRVFAAYSGSVGSAATLKRFLQLKPYEDFELCIATFEMTEQRSHHLLADAADYCRRRGVEPTLRHFPEKAQDNLLTKASEFGADLVVLGNSAKSLLLRRLFGETALKAIKEAEVPLFLSQ